MYNDAPVNPETASALLARLRIRKPFGLHHGIVQVRKNVQRLVEAWDLLRERHKDFGFQLVLAGPLGWKHEEILNAREASRFSDDIILTGPLSATDLPVLIKNASLCVIPSLYEGFCLPMVEAMACGVPTVASNTSCLPEVSGGSLISFDPLSVEDIAVAIMRAIGDSKLRDQLRDKGLRRSAEFSWNRCAL